MSPKLKVLILLTYFERPNLVRGFLRSLLAAEPHHPEWELAFIDDGSTEPGRPIVERILKDHLPKVRFYNSHMTRDMKTLCGGSYMGKFMNLAIQDSDADIAIMTGDDDEIYPEYLRDLNAYFLSHPDVFSCYSGVNIFDPLKEKTCNARNFYFEDPNWKGHAWFGKPIEAAYKVDGTQVAWRLSCNKVWGAYFPSPVWLNHDALFFEELNDRCGLTEYSGLVAQFKGRHDGQLIKRIKEGGDSGGNKVKVLDRPKDVLFL